MSKRLAGCVIVGSAATFGRCAGAATLEATYNFNDTLAAQQAGAPALVPTDPLMQNGFVPQSVFFHNQPVYQFVGNPSPADQQAGLTVNTTNLIGPENYSVEMVVSLSQRDSTWRRLIDVANRQSDDGFYVNPGDNLDVYPVAGSSASFTTGVFHDVVLTNTAGTAKGYLDGSLQFTAATTVMNLDNASNPGLLMNFFLDNVVGSGIGEFSSGQIGLLRLWDGALSDHDVTVLNDAFFIPGDANRDGTVNFSDVLALIQHYGQPGGWSQGDFNADGIVNFTDVLTLIQHYGQSGGAASVAVPEPAGLLLAGFAACLPLRRRRSKP